MSAQALQAQRIEGPHFRQFWEQGTGKEIQAWTGAELNFDLWDQLSPYYFHTDQLADRVMQEVFEHKGFEQGMQYVFSALRNAADHTVHPAVRDLLQDMISTAMQQNSAQLAPGGQLCQRAGLSSLMVLRDYSLMGGYDFAHLNKALIYTGALRKGAVKRLHYTLEFWIKVTRHNALQIHMPGFEQCLRTRLVHAFSRHQILKNSAWQTSQWGAPINSWDMMATYLGFSLVFLHGLKKLNISTTAQEEQSLFALWREIGILIGIPPEIMPTDKVSATQHFYTWTATQPPADQDSVMLAHALLDESLQFEGIKYQFQRRSLRFMHICLNHLFLDQQVLKRLQIPQVSNPKLFYTIIRQRNILQQKYLSQKQQIRKGDKAQVKILQDYHRVNNQ
ncbi:MAG: oxygenase MpaB family protein [Weeksellaceae bacterium]|nr:oxygenase MpaB family protein [Weeksellaceae bacterium]